MSPRPANRPAPSSAAPSSAGGRSTSPIATVALPVLIGGAVGLAALGFALGAGGSFLQARTVGLGLRWPVGAVLALLVLGAVELSAGLLVRSRLGPAVVAAGWVMGVLLMLAGRPEGDVIIAANLPGYLFLLGGVLVLGVLAVLPYSDLPVPPAEPPPG